MVVTMGARPVRRPRAGRAATAVITALVLAGCGGSPGPVSSAPSVTSGGGDSPAQTRAEPSPVTTSGPSPVSPREPGRTQAPTSSDRPTGAPAEATAPASGPAPVTADATTAPGAEPSATPSGGPAATSTTPASAVPAAPTDPAQATATPEPTATPTPPPRTTLELGDRGPAVLALQERLSSLGYWLGRPDGHFGGLTQQAVFALQKAAGLGRDGVVGPRTTAALDSGVRPSSRSGGTGVEIDLDRQLLLIVRDGVVVRVLNTSTGNGERYVSRGTSKVARTPTGAFAVYHQVDALEVAELGELYRPKYFYKGWAVHGSSSVPPYPASHGCARVTNAAMNMMWAEGQLPMGMPVVVY